MSMKEERVRALIVQYDDLIRYRKKLLDCNLAETLLSVIPACVKNQDELEVHLNEKIDECKRIKTRLKAARFKVSKLYAKYKENTEVKEFLDFAVFLSTVGDANEEIIPSSDSDDRDLLPQHNTSLKDYFTDNLINGDSLDLESLNLPTEEEMFDDDDASTLISKLDAEKFQPKYFNSERDKLDYLVKKLCCLLQKYQRQVRLLDERNETNGSNAQTSNLPLKIDEDVQIYNKIHSAVEYDYESSSPSPANSPIDDIPSLEKNDYDVSLLEEKLQGSADLGETAVESKLQTDVTVQGLNVLTNASEASSPIVLPQSPLKTNNVFDIEFIDVNLSVDDCGSTPKKCDTVGACIQIPTSKTAELPNSMIPSHQSSFECDTCGKYFSKKITLILHMREHVKIQVFQCEKCGKSSEKNLVKCTVCDVHENDQAGKDKKKSPIVAPKRTRKGKSGKNDILDSCCNYCGQQYSNKHNLKTHIRQIHTKEKPYKCNECDKRFSDQSNFRRHTLVHGSRKHFKCSVCNESFINRYNRKRHEEVVHEKRARFQCAHCDKLVGQKQDLISHIFIHHFPSFRKHFKCTICDKSLTSKMALKRHKFVHSSKKSFKCSICNNKFKHHRDRMQHEQSIHGEGIRYRCKYCNKGYWHHSFLIRHLKKDHEE